MLLMLALVLADPGAAPGAIARRCFEGDTVQLTPADLLDIEDRFRDSLSKADRVRLDKALPRGLNGGIARCDTVQGSRASCESGAYFPALRTTGLMPRFLKTICPKR